MSDIRKTLDIISEMTAGSVSTVAAPLFKETIKREKPTKVKEGEKKYMNSVERTPNDWGNWADSNKKTVKEAWDSNKSAGLQNLMKGIGDSFQEGAMEKAIVYYLQGRHQEGANFLRTAFKSVAPEVADKIKAQLEKLPTVNVDPNTDAKTQKYIKDQVIPWIKSQLNAAPQSSTPATQTTNYSVGMSDEVAAKKIADKLQGMPVNSSNIQNYVKKYLDMVGRTEKDLAQLSTLVLDKLDNQGVAEALDYDREPLFHATLKAFEPSIIKSGLLPGGNLRMFDWSDKKYVYLSNYADIARDFIDPSVIEPNQEHEDQILNLMKQGGVIFKIDQNKLDRKLLTSDPHFQTDADDGAETYVYSGIIPPSAIIGKEYFKIDESVKGVSEGISPETIHKLADRKNIKWDNEPSFLRLTKKLTGKEHLDDLNQDELIIVKKYLEKQGVAESWKISTPIDKERYTELEGLEGPFRLKSGKIVYYDPKEGKYYDRDTDMYMDYDEYQMHTNEEALMELGYEGNLGAMEMVKFFKMADPRQKEILKDLMAKKEYKRAWHFIQGVTGDKLVGQEFNEEQIAERLSEDLRAWFGKGGAGGAGGGGWDRYNTKGERIGKCGERKAGEGKPKCLSKEKAASLRASGGKKAIAAAVNKKRREDPNPNRQGKADMVSNKTKNESLEYFVKEGICPQCNGPMVSEKLFTEGKKDACYHKVKSRYKIWPSAYASASLVKCRKVGAKNWGKSKNESINEQSADRTFELEQGLKQAQKLTKQIKYDDTVGEIVRGIEQLAEGLGIDQNDLQYYINSVYEAKRELESSIYGLDEPFEYALQQAKFADEESLNEQDLIVMPGKMRMRGDVVKAKRMQPDHEVSMAVNSLLSTIKNSMALVKIIKDRSEERGLPGWVSDHLTRADELVNDVAEYMEGHEIQKNMLEGKKNVKR